MSEFSTRLLFPTNIVVSENNYSLTKEEIEFAESHSTLSYENAGNTTSLNRKILDEPQMQGISNFINMAVKYYVDNIIIPKNDVQFYITQSWFNYTKPNQYHHKHAHPNSIVSGVFYINAEKDVDRITLYKPDPYKRILIPAKEINLHNAESWWFPVETGKVVLFDSNVEHMVEDTKSSTTRISLAFNVFCKGNLGDMDSLTHLEI